jgi:hypothetical protein
MSRVYFHSQSGEAELWGGERAWLGSVVSDIALGFIGVSDCDRMRALVRPGHYLLDSRYHRPGGEQVTWTEQLKTSLKVGIDGDGTLAWDGKPIDTFSLLLNTACAVGNDAVKLAARIHGQSEIHAYIEGIDRAWVAQVIGCGLDAGVFRRNTGYADRKESWEHVSRFLLDRDDEPVVMSYSVTDSFPQRYLTDWEPPAGTELRPSWWSAGEWAGLSEEDREGYHSEARDELWSELPDSGRWGIAMTALRASAGGLRIDPANWHDFRFGHGLTVLDLLAANWEQRLVQALGEVPADD